MPTSAGKCCKSGQILFLACKAGRLKSSDGLYQSPRFKITPQLFKQLGQITLMHKIAACGVDDDGFPSARSHIADYLRLFGWQYHLIFVQLRDWIDS